MAWWQWLLIVVGGFLLAFFVLIAGVALFVRSKWRKLKASIGELGKAFANPVVPQTATLELDDDAALSDAAQSAAEEVRGLGVEVGRPYRVREMANVLLVPLADPSRHLAGTLVDAPPAATGVVDFMTTYADGGTVTHTSAPTPPMDDHDLRPKHRLPGATPTEVLDAHLAGRDDPANRPAVWPTLDDVPRLVREYVEAEYLWRATRGGLTDAELDRQMAHAQAAEGAGDEDTDAARAMTRGLVRGQAAAYLNERFEKAFLEQTTMSAAEWERIEHRLVVVHDAADPDDLSHYLDDDDSADDSEADEADSAASRRLKQGPIRATFAELNAALPPERRLDKLGEATLSNPLVTTTADLYAAPEVAEDSED